MSNFHSIISASKYKESSNSILDKLKVLQFNDQVGLNILKLMHKVNQSCLSHRIQNVFKK